MEVKESPLKLAEQIMVFIPVTVQHRTFLVLWVETMGGILNRTCIR